MDGNNILYQICFNERNIHIIMGLICKEVKLSDRSLPKLEKMIQECMKKNMKRLNRIPRTKDEIKDVVRHLNKYCVDEILDNITKKYPVPKREPVSRDLSKVQMKREMDVWGERENYVVNRPEARVKRQGSYEPPKMKDPLDMMFETMNPNNTGYNPMDGNRGDYASPWDDHTITGKMPNTIDPVSTTPDRYGSDPVNEDYSKRYEMLKMERDKFSGSQVSMPKEIDFSLDDPATKARKKMEREQEDAVMDMMGNDSMSDRFNSGAPSSIDDYYSSILGAGAPQENMPVKTNMTGMGMGSPVMSNQTHEKNQDDRENLDNLSYEKMLEMRSREDTMLGIRPPNTHQMSASGMNTSDNNIFANFMGMN